MVTLGEMIKDLQDSEKAITTLEDTLTQGEDALTIATKILTDFKKLDGIKKNLEGLTQQKKKAAEELMAKKEVLSILTSHKEILPIKDEIKATFKDMTKQDFDTAVESGASHLIGLLNSPQHEVRTHKVLSIMLKNQKLNSAFEKRVAKENELGNNIHDVLKNLDFTVKSLDQQIKETQEEHNTLSEKLLQEEQNAEHFEEKIPLLQSEIKKNKGQLEKVFTQQILKYSVVIKALSSAEIPAEKKPTADKYLKHSYLGLGKTRAKFKKILKKDAPMPNIPRPTVKVSKRKTVKRKEPKL